MAFWRRWSWKKFLNGSAGSYPPVFALIYMFNLIVGAGPLTLPKAFSMAGVLLGSLLLVFLAFMSFITTTFMIEAMANANAYTRYQLRRDKKDSQRLQSPSVQKDLEHLTYEEGSDAEIVQAEKPEKIPLVSPNDDKDSTSVKTPELESDDDIPPDEYEITEKYEMGAIANMFFKPFGIVFYYFIICLYLYGTLAIDLVVITKSLVTVTCTTPPDDDNTTVTLSTQSFSLSNATLAQDLNVTDQDTTIPGEFVSQNYCLGSLTQRDVYYIFLSVIAVLICPWTYFNFTSSKYLQVTTSIARNLAFGLMICIAISKLAMGKAAVPAPPLGSLPGFPILFGTSIYSFMTQHCLPGMITPMTTKRGLTWMILANFCFILGFYLLLCHTAAFLFPSDAIFGIYTINFFKLFEFSDTLGDRVLSALGYYIILYPIFTLTTNFPISSITLRENLKALARIIAKTWIGDESFPLLIDLLLFPTIAVLPSLAIAFGAMRIEILVSITGGFPGIWLQYMIPASLAFAGKFVITRKLKIEYKNKHKSPFSHVVFLVFVIVWTVTSMILVIADDISSIIQGTFFKGIY